MEKIYHNLDIFFLSLLVVFLAIWVYRVFGKKVGLQRKDVAPESIQIIQDEIPEETKNKARNLYEMVRPRYPVGSLGRKLEEVYRIVQSFDQQFFLKTAKEIFTSVVTSYFTHKLEDVKACLGNDLYNKLSSHPVPDMAVEIERFIMVDYVNAEINPDQIQLDVKFFTCQKRAGVSKEYKEIWTFEYTKEKNTTTDITGWLLRVVSIKPAN